MVLDQAALLLMSLSMSFIDVNSLCYELTAME